MQQRVPRAEGKGVVFARDISEGAAEFILFSRRARDGESLVAAAAAAATTWGDLHIYVFFHRLNGHRLSLSIFGSIYRESSSYAAFKLYVCSGSRALLWALE